MLCKRIIPCLDVKEGRVVKGTNFINIQDAGPAVELAKKYYNDGADELVFLDITASIEKRKTLLLLVTEVAKAIRIPYTVGGGISTLEDIDLLLKAGADKVSLNTAVVKNPSLINETSKRFGSQAVVAAVDVKYINNRAEVFIKGGRESTGINGLEWCIEVCRRGAGEILLTSMDKDGTRSGYDVEFLKEIVDNVSIPVIASGGAGKMEHFAEAFEYAGVDACLAAGLFHYGEMNIPELKNYLREKNIEIRL